MTRRSSFVEPAPVIRHRRTRHGMGTWVLISAWLVITVAGLAYLANYEHTPGISRQAPRVWPGASQLERSQQRHTLLLFAHPHCPCTRASFNELACLMADCQNQVDVHVVFVKPPRADETIEWSSGALWNIADEIPGVQTYLDEGGIEARRFASLTSGQVLLFDAKGQLQFQGGITSSRGHSGDNEGRHAVVERILGQKSEFATTLVYGCELGTGDSNGRSTICREGTSCLP
ncbi:MAG: RedB protein [Planctomycetota bacterium]